MSPSNIDIDRSMKWVGGVESVAGAKVRHTRAPIDACRAGGGERESIRVNSGTLLKPLSPPLIFEK